VLGKKKEEGRQKKKTHTQKCGDDGSRKKGGNTGNNQ
jgi:hypothetical protein